MKFVRSGQEKEGEDKGDTMNGTRGQRGSYKAEPEESGKEGKFPKKSKLVHLASPGEEGNSFLLQRTL